MIDNIGIKHNINSSEVLDETETLAVPEKTQIRKRSSAQIIQPESISIQTINQRYFRLQALKEQLLIIRERKASIPLVPDPQIVDVFQRMKQKKKHSKQKQALAERIKNRKKQYQKLKYLHQSYQQEYEDKQEQFLQKSSLLKLLSSKMQNQLIKTKQRYREVEFNKMVFSGVKRLLYYRIAEIFFNENCNNIFNMVNQFKNLEEKYDEDSIANSYAYLTLFMCMIGQIAGARMWLNFQFKGHRSTIRLSDGTIVNLHPKEPRFNDVLQHLKDQLYQLMTDTLQLKVEKLSNFLQLGQQLTKEIMIIK